jgi:hypothetical protein
MKAQLLLAVLAAATAISTPACAEWASCTPVNVAQIEERIHIQCEQPVSVGAASIHFISLPTTGGSDESQTAARFMAVGMTAIVTGKQVGFWFTAGDTSGSSYGCGADNCRKPTAFFLLR